MSTIPAASRAFDIALSNFTRDLTAKEKLDFAQASIDDVYTEAKKIQERQGQKGLLRNMKRIQPYINGLVQFSGVIEVFIQAKPEIMAFIWGPTKFLLQITSTHIDSFDKLLNALEKIGENLPRFQVFAEVFQSDLRIEQVVVMVYEDILSFYQCTLKFFRAKAWKVIFKSLWCTFEDTFGRILSNLERHKILLDNEATAANIVAAHGDRAAALRAERDTKNHREMQHRRYLREWLDPIDYDAYLTGLGRPCPTTGAWLVQEGGVKVWLDIGDITKRLLWLTGIPGSGKTLLSSSMLQHVRSLLRTQGSGSVVFAFLGDGNSSFARIMRTLVFQLLLQNTQLLGYLNDIYESKVYPLTSPEELEKVLEAMLGNIGITYLIIDGLDEIELGERSMVLSALLSLFSKADNLKIFISSRPEVDISDALKPVINDIYRVDVGENNKTDIATYVSVAGQEVLNRFNVDDATLKDIQGILNRVAHGAEGMFLWARLVIYNLLQQFDLEGLEDAARNLPVGLDAAYGRILQRINEKLSPKERDLAGRVLEWVLCGTRPLRLKELEQALAIRGRERCTDRRRKLLIRLDELCGPILEIGAGEKVHFVHFTAKEYLTSTYSGPFIQPSAAHRNIASVCISYLSFDCFNSDSSDEKVIENISSGEYCLHEYAERNWLHHIRHATKEYDHHLNDLIHLLNRFIELRRDARVPHTISSEETFPIIFDHWPQVHEHLVDCCAYYSGTYHPNSTERSNPLKLQEPVERFRKHLENLFSSLSLPKDDIQLRFIQGTYGTNLFKCLQFNCVHYLEGFETRKKRDEHLKTHSRPFKCSVKACDFSSMGFASAGALDRHLRLYHQNLDTNTVSLSLAEVDYPGSLGKDPDLSLILFDAIATGDRACVESVLIQGLDINSTNECGETALYYALTAGSEEIIHLLLQKGADVDAKGRNGDTALIVGAKRRDGGPIVKLLLAKGVDVNSKSQYEWTALMWAAHSGCEETVQLLLEGGADVDAKDSNRNTALIVGAKRRDGGPIVKLLLAKGVDVNSKNQNGWTALMRAAESGCEETVQLLLEGGADVDAKASNGNTALIVGAKRRDGGPIVKLLLTKEVDVNSKSQYGWTALMGAAQSGCEETVQLLLEGGADVGLMANTGDSALVIGARASSCVPAVKLLLENGMEIDSKGRKGRTALMVAAKSGLKAMTQVLLEYGARVDVEDDDGETPLTKAHPRVLPLLQRFIKTT